MEEPKSQKLAEELVESVKQELSEGTKHYNDAGELLTTPEEILDCLVHEDKVTIEPTSTRKHLFGKPD